MKQLMTANTPAPSLFAMSSVGAAKLMHVMLVITVVALIGTGVQTYRLAQDSQEGAPHMLTLSPNQRLGLLAQKWREERNFWCASCALARIVYLRPRENIIVGRGTLAPCVQERTQTKHLHLSKACDIRYFNVVSMVYTAM